MGKNNKANEYVPEFLTLKRNVQLNDEPATDEPATDEPATDEPATDEPATDEPASDEPASDEPASDEPASDEPKPDEPSKKTRVRKKKETTTPENFFSDFKEDTNIEEKEKPKPKNKKYSNGKALLTIINVVLPIILSIVTKQSIEALKFTDDEIKLLEPSADDFCIENKIEINGSITFFVLLGSMMYSKCDFSRFKKKKAVEQITE